MKISPLRPRLLATIVGTLALTPFVASADESVPVGEGAVPVGEEALPVGEGAVPVGEGAVPVGEGAVPVGEGAVPVGEGAVPVGEGAVPIGEGAVPVGEGAVPVGEGAVPVGEGAVPVGEGAVPVGEGAVPVGEGAVPVGEGAVPVGEGATPADAATIKLRRANRAAAQKAPETAHFFSDNSGDTSLNERLSKAIQINSSLSQSVTAERRRENSEWAEQALASATSRPADLFSRTWWNEHKPSGASSSYFTTKSSAIWWGATNWPTLARVFAIPGGTKPFAYVYDQNVTFKSDLIYVNGQPISSYEDFVASSRKLANSFATKDNDPNWIPFGTFALSTSVKTKTSDHAVQLVVDADGNIAGTYANWKNGTVESIHGRVDIDTQRVAFDIGGQANLTIETGLTNLTNDKVRVWAHLPNNHSQTWFLARMRR